MLSILIHIVKTIGLNIGQSFGENVSTINPQKIIKLKSLIYAHLHK